MNSITQFILNSIKIVFHVFVFICCFVLIMAMVADLTGAKSIWSVDVNDHKSFDLIVGVVSLCCAIYCFVAVMECLFGKRDLKAPELPMTKSELLIRQLYDAIKIEDYEKAGRIRNTLRGMGVTEYKI